MICFTFSVIILTISLIYFWQRSVEPPTWRSNVKCLFELSNKNTVFERDTVVSHVGGRFGSNESSTLTQNIRDIEKKKKLCFRCVQVSGKILKVPSFNHFDDSKSRKFIFRNFSFERNHIWKK